MDQHTLAALFHQYGMKMSSFLPSVAFEDGLSYQVEVQSSNDLTTWQTLRSLVDVTGYWPVLTSRSLEDIMESQSGERRPPYEIIDEGLRLNAENWVHQSIEAYRSFYHHDVPRGKWPNTTPPMSSSTTGGTQAPRFEPLILLPTTEGWRVPAYLNFGGWNGCPSAPAHVCMMKHWQEHYGAEIMFMGSDTVAMDASRPPQDRESALRLAWEQFAYCSDTIGVAPGIQTLEDVAAKLLNASVWGFWWD